MGTVFKKELSAEQRPQASLHGLAHGESKSKWISEFLNKPSFHAARGIWARLTRTMFRKGQYTEEVVDPATGEVLHYESHPLGEHTGRGNAKRGTSSPS